MKGEIMNKLVTVDSKENSEFLRKKMFGNNRY